MKKKRRIVNGFIEESSDGGKSWSQLGKASQSDIDAYNKHLQQKKSAANTSLSGKQVDVYNKTFTDSLQKKLQEKGLKSQGILPGYLYNPNGSINQNEFFRSVNDVQGLRPGTQNIYGKYEWNSPEFMTDFAKRHAWYLKEHPDFNPNDKTQVAQFQDAYNKRANQLGLPDYFSNSEKFKKDSLFGQNTYSAPSLNYEPEQPQQENIPFPEESPKTKAANVPIGDHITGQNVPELPADYWLQDKVKTFGAFNDLNRIHKYMPWQANYNPTMMNPTFYDPTRELAANASLANTSSQAVATYAGPQSMNARLAQIQGNAAANAANILGRYNGMNVGVANQFEAQNAGIMNQYSADQANRATNLFDKTTIVNQQFDNAKNMARQNLRQSYIDAITNRAQTQALNSMQNQYRVDPNTGGFVYFTKGRQMVPGTQSNPYEDRASTFSKLKEQYPNIPDEQLMKLITG